MTTPFEISDRFTDRWAELRPISATNYGIPGHDDECGDFSPEGESRLADLYRATRTDLASHLYHPDRAQAFAAKVITGWLDERIAAHEEGCWGRDLNHIESPFQNARDVFDVMPKETAADWDNIVARLHRLGPMLEGHRESLAVGRQRGDTVAVRQVESVIEQAEFAASEQSMFMSFPVEAANAGVDPEAVENAVSAARMACGEFAGWLREIYLPDARPEDAVGEERYVRRANRFLGMGLDPQETYEWGWTEVQRLRSEMVSTAGEIERDMSVEEVIELLKVDPARSAATRHEFVEFISSLQQQAIVQLDGTHFEVPEELKTVDVNMAPPGVPLGAWYIGPSEDLSRPGSIWYAPGERERLPYWQEVSTGYHEGFPGHHLQVGTAVLQRASLSRFHRMVIWYPGSGEGWALYAERLMDELGYFEKPEYRLGLLASQLFRSTRVIVDIGCQLGLRLPETAPLHGGEEWDFEKGVDYMSIVAYQPRDVSESEVKRYLGWWGQAITYKVGEREILKIRDDVMRRQGAAFDRKDFHRRVLEAGAIRLDDLREELA